MRQTIEMAAIGAVASMMLDGVRRGLLMKDFHGAMAVRIVGR